MALDDKDDTDFVKFWNTVLEPKFTKYRHILQGGLSRHSAAVIPNLPIKEGMSVLGSVDNHLEAMSVATRFQHAA